MTYYLVIDGEKRRPAIIGSVTLGNTMLAEEGWQIFQGIVNSGNIYRLEYEIIDEKGRRYSGQAFLDKASKFEHIIEN